MATVEARHWWFVARRKIFAEVIPSSSSPRDQTIVDVGCGTGGNLALLRQFGSVIGLELDPDSVKMASAHGLVVHGGSSKEWPIASYSVDTISAFDVLEHIPDHESAMSNMYGSLKSGGIMVLSVPAYQWLWSEHDVIVHHQRRYVLPDVVSLAESTGFVVEYASYHNCLLFPVSCLLRLVSRLSGGRVATDNNQIPAEPVNTILKFVYSLERYAIRRRWRIPFGLSIVAVLRKT